MNVHLFSKKQVFRAFLERNSCACFLLAFKLKPSTRIPEASIMTCIWHCHRLPVVHVFMHAPFYRIVLSNHVWAFTCSEIIRIFSDYFSSHCGLAGKIPMRHCWQRVSQLVKSSAPSKTSFESSWDQISSTMIGVLVAKGCRVHCPNSEWQVEIPTRNQDHQNTQNPSSRHHLDYVLCTSQYATWCWWTQCWME